MSPKHPPPWQGLPVDLSEKPLGGRSSGKHPCLFLFLLEEGEGRVASKRWAMGALEEEIPRKGGGESGGEVFSKQWPKYSPTTKTSENEFFSQGLKGKAELHLPSQAAQDPSPMVSLGPLQTLRGRKTALPAAEPGSARASPCTLPGWLPSNQITTKYGQKNA